MNCARGLNCRNQGTATGAMRYKFAIQSAKPNRPANTMKAAGLCNAVADRPADAAARNVPKPAIDVTRRDRSVEVATNDHDASLLLPGITKVLSQREALPLVPFKPLQSLRLMVHWVLIYALAKFML